MDDLPPPLIGHIACNLSQTDYINLSKCNRSTYVGCNTPNMLQKLDLLHSNVDDYSTIKLSNYPQIKRLYIKLPKFPQLLSNMDGSNIIGDKLKQLRLSNEELVDTTGVTSFLSQNIINMNNVITIGFQKFGLLEDAFDTNIFCKLLSKFDKQTVKNLEFYNITLDRKLDPDIIKNNFPQVRALSLLGTSAHKELLNTLGSQLEILVVDNFGHFSDLTNINFNNLKKLTCILPTVNGIKGILKTAINLTDFNIVPKAFMNQLMNDNEIKELLSNDIIFKQNKLKTLYIGIDADKFKLFIDSIELGLFKIRKQERDEFYIWFNLNYIGCNNNIDDMINPQQFVIYISRLINSFHVSKIKQFAILWEIGLKEDLEDGKQYKKQLIKCVNDFVESSAIIKLIKDKKDSNTTVIGNIECENVDQCLKFWQFAVI